MCGVLESLQALRVRTSAVAVSEVDYQGVEPTIWDDFAQNCAASYQSAYCYLAAWALKHRFRYQLRLFELHVGEKAHTRKIGQCAVGVRGTVSTFLGELQLLTAHAELWPDAMAALLSKLGPGRYRYGSGHSLERCRENDLKKIESVTIESVRPLVVEAVDFSRWPTWDDYRQSISSNSRRNARHAETFYPDLSLVIRQGFRSTIAIPALLNLRAWMYRRKGIAFEPLRAGMRDLFMILGCPDHVLTAVVSGGNRALAAIAAIEFGPHVYYAHGGSKPDNGGAAWYLTLAMLRRTYERDPSAAKFVMGYVDYATHDPKIGGGLLRFRRSCRVSDYPTSVVAFAYGL